MFDVIVIGGGISGMAVANRLLHAGVRRESICVLESHGRPGGNIWTDVEEGFVLEAGPNGFLDNSPPTLELVSDLDLDERLLVSRQSAAVRYIYSRGKLRKVPKGPIGLLSSGLLSPVGTARIFLEPFMPRGETGETVFDFASRRIGREAAATLVGSMVSGVFAGDARNLELEAAFPKMAAMEERYRSLVRAMLSKVWHRWRAHRAGQDMAQVGGPSGPAGRLTSFRGGMQELIDALAQRLGDALRMGWQAMELHPLEQGWQVRGLDETLEAQAVVLACPARHAAALLQPVDERVAKLLSSITSASLAVVATGYRSEDLSETPNGFGFLVPRGGEERILGCLWSSSIWEGRAPEDHVLLRTMIGGAHDPEVVDASDSDLLEVVARDLQRIMGLTARPVFARIYRHRLGIAQYEPGHLERLRRLRGLLQEYPGVYLSGSSYGGISINHAVAEAPSVAREVLESLR